VAGNPATKDGLSILRDWPVFIPYQLQEKAEFGDGCRAFYIETAEVSPL
jgi:hypothetical protein